MDPVLSERTGPILELSNWRYKGVNFFSEKMNSIMKKADMSTHEANTVIDPLIGICAAEWSTSLQCAGRSEKEFRNDWREKVVS